MKIAQHGHFARAGGRGSPDRSPHRSGSSWHAHVSSIQTSASSSARSAMSAGLFGGIFARIMTPGSGTPHCGNTRVSMNSGSTVIFPCNCASSSLDQASCRARTHAAYSAVRAGVRHLPDKRQQGKPRWTVSSGCLRGRGFPVNTKCRTIREQERA